MTDRTIDLDQHRGMAAQKATELRRLLADVETDQKALRVRQEELESHLLASPAANWHEAAEKAAISSICLLHRYRHRIRAGKR
jgi:hypothetical protein